LCRLANLDCLPSILHPRLLFTFQQVFKFFNFVLVNLGLLPQQLALFLRRLDNLLLLSTKRFESEYVLILFVAPCFLQQLQLLHASKEALQFILLAVTF
jgi:hypothetical protein